MNSQKEQLLGLRVLLLSVLLLCLSINVSRANKRKDLYGTGRMITPKSEKQSAYQQKMCVPVDDTVRAKRKSCLLRPDSGPCRADVIAWYYDARQRKCFRFFWGGCQGNGNKWATLGECLENCYLNATMEPDHLPYFCLLSFDYGHCFGQYNRWGWDKIAQSCRRHLYSGCGGNQNNFETKHECMATCLTKPNNTMGRFQMYTTCIPFTIADLQ